MTTLFEQHQDTLQQALQALRQRGYWSAYPEMPSGKMYGESAKADGEAAFQACLNHDFDLPGHPGTARAGAESSPYQVGNAHNGALGVRYPAADASTLLAHAQAAAKVWSQTTAEQRLGICLEILARLNRRSFEIANAVMHTSGQAFAMAFQAGGPHAQDRALEALAYVWQEMQQIPASAQWVKPQGRAGDLVLNKQWAIVPRGISLVIGCQTFPTWNSYSGLFASLATGNVVIAKPHPQAILPMALTVKIAREVLAEQGLPADVVLLAAENPPAAGTEGLAMQLARSEEVALIDYTGSNAFAQWLRTNAATRLLYTEEAGVNSIVLSGVEQLAPVLDNIAFSLALYSGQMCTAPQCIFVPRGGIPTADGQVSLDDIAQALAAAVDKLLADPARAAAVCGAIAADATLERIATARSLGRIVRDSAPLTDAGTARTASPLIVAVDAADEAAYTEERFGPIAFIVATDGPEDSTQRAAHLARKKGAITAALYDTDEARIATGINAFAAAGTNLSINLTALSTKAPPSATFTPPAAIRQAMPV